MMMVTMLVMIIKIEINNNGDDDGYVPMVGSHLPLFFQGTRANRISKRTTLSTTCPKC